MSALSGAQPRSTEAKPDAPNILVVDDSSAARARVSDLLQKQGYSVSAVSSGEEAFSECFEQAYDLIVSDVTMGALSGVQLCRLLRNDPCTKDLPILLLTARDDPMSRFWGRHAGADSYIAKDRIQEELIDTVKRLLQGASGRVTTAPELSVPPSSPMTRLSEVLEENLFHAVLASEARSLQEHASSRKELSRAILRLAGELTCASYIVVRLDGRPAPSYALLSRAPFIREPEHVSALGIPSEMTRAVDVIDSAEATIQDSAVAIGEAFSFPIVSGLEELGEIRFFGGLKRVSSSECQIGSLLAAEVASIAKNVLLVEETRRLADTCSLTGLANRRYVSERLDQELQRAERYGTPVSIALCDADHFKRVNDEYGHNIGDEVLRKLAETIEETIRTVDYAGRWGGEEFLVVLPETASTGARIFAERLRANVERHVRVHEGPPRVTVSIGISSWQSEDTIERMVERADICLYRAKGRGRNRVEL